jgi:hypothetical protein
LRQLPRQRDPRFDHDASRKSNGVSRMGMSRYPFKRHSGWQGSMSSVANRAPHGCFVDRTREPSRASVRKALGVARAAWDDLEEHLTVTYRLKSLFHFMYGERYGWALRFHRSGRLVLAMYPNHGRLTVQIILSQAQIAVATTMTLPSKVIRAIEAARNYPEGRWLFIPVRSGKSAKELRSLIALKMSRPGASRSTNQPARQTSSQH